MLPLHNCHQMPPRLSLFSSLSLNHLHMSWCKHHSTTLSTHNQWRVLNLSKIIPNLSCLNDSTFKSAPEQTYRDIKDIYILGQSSIWQGSCISDSPSHDPLEDSCTFLVRLLVLVPPPQVWEQFPICHSFHSQLMTGSNQKKFDGINT